MAKEEKQIKDTKALFLWWFTVIVTLAPSQTTHVFFLPFLILFFNKDDDHDGTRHVRLTGPGICISNDLDYHHDGKTAPSLLVTLESLLYP
jgi:hypothetical protein